MGLFDKLKSVTKMVTGGGAKVYVNVPAATVREPFKVTVKAVVAEGGLKIDEVYLLIEANEEVRVSSDATERTVREVIQDFKADGKLDGVTERETTCELKVNVSGPQELAPNREYSWETTVTLPAGAVPSFRGRKCEHVWRVQAGLAAFGNDPDSGWVAFEVR